MMLHSEISEAKMELSRWWWVYLVGGIIWLIIAVIVLRFTITSAATIGLLLGAVFLFAAVAQFMWAAMQGGGWAVFRIILGILFVGGAFWSFVDPYNAFWSLATVFGLLLILNGAFDITRSVMSRPVNPVWWLGLVAGILQIGLGFWASQQYVPARATLLILWVGFFALFRGIADLVLAFEVRSLS